MHWLSSEQEKPDNYSPIDEGGAHELFDAYSGIGHNNKMNS